MIHDDTQRPLRPTQHVEHVLVTSILNGTFPVGTALPGERVLAQKIGVTRPTLRETLHRLAKEGWITIHHGKPTVITDYWRQGGLSLLSTLAKYGDYLPAGFIPHLMEVRLTIMPPIAAMAAKYNPQPLLSFLNHAPKLNAGPEPYAAYDWELQMMMAHNCPNPIFALILNDFATLFKTTAMLYFRDEKARSASSDYYRNLFQTIGQNSANVESVVRRAMQQSIAIWQTMKSRINSSDFR